MVKSVCGNMYFHYFISALPILQLQYGGTTGALAAPPAPTSSLTHFSLPNTTSTAVNGGPAPYAFLNGQNQVSCIYTFSDAFDGLAL